MNVVFYINFRKRPNSTLKPFSNYANTVTLDCKLLDNTSIISPVLVIEKPTENNISDFTYCYISDFGRYYFVNNIVYANGLYVLSLAGDVLASYSQSIKNSYQYVARSGSSYDDNIVDTVYITKPFSDIRNRTGASTYGSRSVNRFVLRNSAETSESVDYFVVRSRSQSVLPVEGVCFALSGANGVGANYYVCTSSAFITFISNIFAYVPSDMGTLADGVKKVLLDLEQYILSVVRLPVMPDSSNLGTYVTSVKVGPYDIACNCYTITQGYDYEEYELTNGLSIPKHPNVSTHSYYQLPPFSSYVLDFYPLGSIPLDAAKLYNVDTLNIRWRIDYTSGQALFKVGYLAGSKGFQTLFEDIAQVGIPIPLSQLKVDNAMVGLALAGASAANNYLKSLGSSGIINSNTSSSLSSVADTKMLTIGDNFAISISPSGFGNQSVKGLDTVVNDVKENLIGNFIEPNTSLIDQIIDYAGSIFGDVHVKGSTGTYLTYVAGLPELRAFFVDQADNDNDRFGRPLYQRLSLITLTGFCQCKNAMINYFSETHQPTLTEIKAVYNLLNSGIYLE